MSDFVRIRTNAVAVGGDAIGRTAEGKVVFVEGALPDEEIGVEIIDDRKDFAKGVVAEIYNPNPDRIQPKCIHAVQGCGGCDLAFVNHHGQLLLKKRIVTDALVRIGKVREAASLVSLAPDLATSGYRTTVRAVVSEGRAGFRVRGTHRAIEVDSCFVSHPVVERLLVEGRYGEATEITIRLGHDNTVLLVADAPESTLVLPDLGSGFTVLFTSRASTAARREANKISRSRRDGAASAPGAERVAAPAHDDGSEDHATDQTDGTDQTDAGDRGDDLTHIVSAPTVTSVKDGLGTGQTGEGGELIISVGQVELQVSPDSFFQTRLDGAEQLLELVEGALALPSDETGDILVDLYGGVGLFGAVLGGAYATVISVESNPFASADAELNMATHPDGNVICEDVDGWRPPLEHFEGHSIRVIADPSRAGLGRKGVETIVRLEPDVIVLVSCDAASLGRDTALLQQSGYSLTGSVIVDLFPHTSHVEVVSQFVAAFD